MHEHAHTPRLNDKGQWPPSPPVLCPGLSGTHWCGGSGSSVRRFCCTKREMGSDLLSRPPCASPLSLSEQLQTFTAKQRPDQTELGHLNSASRGRSVGRRREEAAGLAAAELGELGELGREWSGEDGRWRCLRDVLCPCACVCSSWLG